MAQPAKLAAAWYGQAHHDIETLLSETVLSAYDQETQAFLLRLFILDVFPPRQAATVCAAPADSFVEKLYKNSKVYARVSVTNDSVLSQRERAMLEKVFQGLDDTTIAADLSLSPKTVRNILSRAYAKIGVNNHTAFTVQATKNALLWILLNKEAH